jgi:hypothetical protein
VLSILKAFADKQNKVLQVSFPVEPPHIVASRQKACFFYADFVGIVIKTDMELSS